MLEQVLAADLFAVVLVFARIGGALMLLPGFGEIYVPARIRLLLALTITVVVAPVIAHRLPGLPASPLALFLLVGGEIAIGVFLGLIARILLASLHTVGVIIGFQTGLANAMVFDPANAQQGSLFGAFLTIVGIMLIFASDLHHLMLMAVADSYTVFGAGDLPAMGDVSELGARLVAKSFALALQIAAPFVVFGLMFYLGLGLLARLMPQMHVFFVVMPLQITLGFLVFTAAISAGMMWFLTAYQEAFIGFLGGP